MRYPVGDPAQGGADSGPGLDSGQVLHDELAVVVGVDAHQYRGIAAGQRARGDTGILEGLPADLECQPLLRVHQFGLTR